jgi:3-methyladenine DNA glycosylase AlkD
MMKHGCQEPIYGAKVADLKVLQKKIKKDQALALALYESGVYEAMYLAGLVADGGAMTEKQLQYWVEHARSPAISEYTVPWVTAEHPQAWKLGLKWIDSKDEKIACSGWNTLGGIVSLKPDEELDIPKLKELLKRVQTEIHTAPNRVRYTMNGFLIGVGTYVDALSKEAIAVAKKVGL